MIILKENLFNNFTNTHSKLKSEEDFLIACRKNDLDYVLKNYQSIFKTDNKEFFLSLKHKKISKRKT